MKFKLSEMWSLIRHYYFENSMNYSIYNDPNLTYQEFILISNVKGMAHANAHFYTDYDIIDTEIDTFSLNEHIFEENYVAHYFQENFVYCGESAQIGL